MVYGDEAWDGDDIVAVLERNDRVCGITRNWKTIRKQRNAAAIPGNSHVCSFIAKHVTKQRQSFPWPLGNSFLGGSAPRLQSPILGKVLCPGLRKLLQSAIHLVTLELLGIPHSGYFPPEAMVIGLPALTRLENLIIGFDSPQCRSDWKNGRLSSPTRIPLPVLTAFQFKRVGEYLEDLMGSDSSRCPLTQ